MFSSEITKRTLARGHANLVWNRQNQFGKVQAPLKRCRRKKEKAGEAVSPAPWPDWGQDPLLSEGPAFLEQKLPVPPQKAGSFVLSVLCTPVGGLFPGPPPGGGRGPDARLTWGSLPFWAAFYLRSSGHEFWACLVLSALGFLWPCPWLYCRLIALSPHFDVLQKK